MVKDATSANCGKSACNSVIRSHMASLESTTLPAYLGQMLIRVVAEEQFFLYDKVANWPKKITGF